MLARLHPEASKPRAIAMAAPRSASNVRRRSPNRTVFWAGRSSAARRHMPAIVHESERSDLISIAVRCDWFALQPSGSCSLQDTLLMEWIDVANTFGGNVYRNQGVLACTFDGDKRIEDARS
jgi:hypothetical protein